LLLVGCTHDVNTDSNAFVANTDSRAGNELRASSCPFLQKEHCKGDSCVIDVE
jgi:hypothetical protein